MDDYLVDLTTGGTVIEADDERLGPASSLLQPSDEGGAWITRRSRSGGHDWAMVRLGMRGVLHRIVLDTSGIVGDLPDTVGLEAIDLGGEPNIVDLVRHRELWFDALPRISLTPDAVNEFAVPDQGPVTHVRLVVYPDGGIARLRCFGDPVAAEGSLSGEVDLALLRNGARVIDAAGGGDPNAMLGGGDPAGDGWVTRRRRDAGSDWAVVRLAGPGHPTRFEIDERTRSGDAPAACTIEGIHAPGAAAAALRSAVWTCIVDEAPVAEGEVTALEAEDAGLYTHLRLTLHPDGAVGRFRVPGQAEGSWIG
jgi:allantoicase